MLKTVKASKDIDQTKDTGGKFEHKDLSKPGRDDKRHRYNEKEINREDRDDYKDTLFDHDLKTGDDKMDRITRIAHSVAVYAANLGQPWSNEEDHIERVKKGEFVRAFHEFFEAINKSRKDYYDKNYPTQYKPLTFQKGKNYIKIIDDGSVYGFVNMANGDVLKAAGWNAPAKHARANIFERNSWKNCGPYSPAYLR